MFNLEGSRYFWITCAPVSLGEQVKYYTEIPMHSERMLARTALSHTAQVQLMQEEYFG